MASITEICKHVYAWRHLHGPQVQYQDLLEEEEMGILKPVEKLRRNVTAVLFQKYQMHRKSSGKKIIYPYSLCQKNC